MLFAQTADPTLYTVQTTTVTTSSSSSLVWALVISLVVWVVMIVAFWKVFTKAGEAGWKCIIPIYNTYTLCRIAGRNGWWFLGLLVPVVNIIVSLIISIDLAKHFGKSTVFGVVGLWIFSVIGYLMLGYGDAEYVGPKHA